KSNDRFAKPISVRFMIPLDRFVYDVRAGKALGRVSEIPVTLDPYEPTIFAIAPSQIAALELSTPTRIKRGESATPGVSFPAASLPTVIDQVRGGYRSAEAMGLMRDVYASDRYFTFPRFHATAEYLKKKMQDAGLSSVEIVEAPADGVTQVGYWTMPLAWDVKSATLEILDDSLPVGQRMLADYEKVPASLGMWSGPTKREGVTAQVIALNKSDVANIAKMDVRGKLVLTDQNPA